MCTCAHACPFEASANGAILENDEVSQLHPKMLNSFEQLARFVRKSGVPFERIHVVLYGVFVQIPPVRSTDQPARFYFEAACWTKLFPDTN